MPGFRREEHAAFWKADAEAVDTLQGACAVSGGYLEPVACGVKRWEEDDGSPLLAFARAEGLEVLGEAHIPGTSPRA